MTMEFKKRKKNWSGTSKLKETLTTISNLVPLFDSSKKWAWSLKTVLFYINQLKKVHLSSVEKIPLKRTKLSHLMILSSQAIVSLLELDNLVPRQYQIWPRIYNNKLKHNQCLWLSIKLIHTRLNNNSRKKYSNNKCLPKLKPIGQRILVQFKTISSSQLLKFLWLHHSKKLLLHLLLVSRQDRRKKRKKKKSLPV